VLPAFSAQSPRIPRSTIAAWASWDWGSSAFPGVVTSFIFTVYITDPAFGDPAHVSSLLGVSLIITGILVAIIAPAYGHLTDIAGRRKLWLAITTGVLVISTGLMALVAPTESHFVFGLVLLGAATIGFELACVSYNAMLPQISTRANVGRISGIGWGMGYFGSIALLILLLVGFIFPEVGWFGVTGENGWNIRVAMLFTAAWTAVFALPVLFAVPDPVHDTTHAWTRRSLFSAYRDLWLSLGDMWKHSRPTLHFLLASAVFRDGVAGTAALGGVIAARSFGMDDDAVGIFGIAALFVSGIATVIVAQFEDRIGSLRVILGSLIIMVLASVVLFLIDLPGATAFWVFGLILCLLAGPVQSGSRAYFAKLIPPGREGEYFGLYATTGRAASFLTPAAFAISIAIGGTPLAGTLGLSVVLLVGLLLTLGLREPKVQAGVDRSAGSPVE